MSASSGQGLGVKPFSENSILIRNYIIIKQTLHSGLGRILCSLTYIYYSLNKYIKSEISSQSVVNIWIFKYICEYSLQIIFIFVFAVKKIASTFRHQRHCILHCKWNLQSADLTNLYIYDSNELNLMCRVQYGLGSTMALTECILIMILILSANGWTSWRTQCFPACWVAKVATYYVKYTIPL